MVTVRGEPEERERLKQAALEAGLSMEGYVRRCLGFNNDPSKWTRIRAKHNPRTIICGPYTLVLMSRSEVRINGPSRPFIRPGSVF